MLDESFQKPDLRERLGYFERIMLLSIMQLHEELMRSYLVSLRPTKPCQGLKGGLRCFDSLKTKNLTLFI